MVAEDLTVIVNTGDDTEIYGVHVSPDVDIVTYWLAGVADTSRGWGIRDDTFGFISGLRDLGHESWFHLGDRDLATCFHRTERLREGASLSTITEDIRRLFEVRCRVLPMTDDAVRTLVHLRDGRQLGFQEYFVKEHAEPAVARVEYVGAAKARPAKGVVDAIEKADVVVVCPSNPVLSIGPILAIPGIRPALVKHPRVVAVSPIVRGAAIKGPAARLMATLFGEASATRVAQLYEDFCDTFIIDETEYRSVVADVRAFAARSIPLQTMMEDTADSTALARKLLAA